MSTNKETVLITGSGGSLMSATIPFIDKDKYRIVEVDLDGYTGPNYIADLCNSIQVDHIFEEVKPDYVVQAAASVYGIAGFNKNRADILGNDITLHRNVLKSAVEHKTKRVIFISSSMVYERLENGKAQEDWVISDEYKVPKTEYGLSKYVNEQLSRAYAQQHGLEYVIWRPFNVITPFEVSKDEPGVSHVFADLIENIVGQRLTEIPIIGDGLQVRCFTWIDDVAEAIARYSFLPMLKNSTFNLGASDAVNIRELSRYIKYIATELYHGTDEELIFKTIKEFPNDVRYRVPDTERAETTLGWTAKTSLTESLKRCIVEYYRRQKW